MCKMCHQDHKIRDVRDVSQIVTTRGRMAEGCAAMCLSQQRKTLLIADAEHTKRYKGGI